MLEKNKKKIITKSINLDLKNIHAIKKTHMIISDDFQISNQTLK